MTLHEEVHIGSPFEFKLVSTVLTPTHGSPQQLHSDAQFDQSTSWEFQRSEDVKQRLRAGFQVQWARFKNTVSEILKQEAHDLSLPAPEKSLFQTCCRFLSMQNSPKSAMLAQRRQQGEEQLRWEGVIIDGMLTEEARRKAVERRVHALLLKFR